MLFRNSTEILPKFYRNATEILLKLYQNSRQNGILYTSHRAEISIVIYAFEITLLDYYHRIMVAVFYR